MMSNLKYVLMVLWDGYLIGKLSVLVHVPHCTITTKPPQKQSQRKVKLCHQFPPPKLTTLRKN